MQVKGNCKTFDGVPLYYSKVTPIQPKAVVVLVHGLAEHLGRYDELTSQLTKENFAVYRFDHRGHGKSEGDRGYYSDFNELIEDVHVMVEMAKKDLPALPVFLLGHSMGGFASACFGTKYPNKVKGIVLSGALTRDNKALLQEIPEGLPLKEYLPNGLGHLICTDQGVVEDYMNDPLVLTEITAGLFYELKKGVAWLKEHKAAFVAPVLLLHGCDDQLVLEKDSRDFYGDIASTDKELKIYAHLYHEILNEPCKQKVFNEIIAWLHSHS